MTFWLFLINLMEEKEKKVLPQNKKAYEYGVEC